MPAYLPKKQPQKSENKEDKKYISFPGGYYPPSYYDKKGDNFQNAPKIKLVSWLMDNFS